MTLECILVVLLPSSFPAPFQLVVEYYTPLRYSQPWEQDQGDG